MSFGHKAVISSLFKLNIVSENLFYKSCLVWYAPWKYDIKSESLAVIWTHISHVVNLSETWYYLQTLVHFARYCTSQKPKITVNRVSYSCSYLSEKCIANSGKFNRDTAVEKTNRQKHKGYKQTYLVLPSWYKYLMA